MQQINSNILTDIVINHYNNGWYLQRGSLVGSPLELIPDNYQRLQVMAEANDLVYPIKQDHQIYAEVTKLFTGEKEIIKTGCKSHLSFVNLWACSETLEQLAAKTITVYKIAK